MGKRYHNPPVIEAVCEFRFDPSSPWDMAMPGLMYERLKEKYPKRRQVSAVDVIVSTEEPLKQKILRNDRLHFLSADDKAIVQVGPHLLAVNRLAPYSSWESFFPSIQYAFSVYRETADPKALVRVGLKYVNRIIFPKAAFSLEDYFEFYPFLGSRLPQLLQNFFLGVEFSFESGRDGLRLQMQTAASEQDNTYSFLLDLDHFAVGAAKVSFDYVFNWLELAHARIEDVFEGCLKEAIRQRFGVAEESS